MSLKIMDLSFSYGEREVLKNISFEANFGEFWSILGANGVGKSTLFRCILGLLTPSGGQRLLGEKNLADLSASALARHLAYIPQSHNPVFNYSVFDMVLMGTTAQTGKFSSPGKAQADLAKNALERLGILHLADRGYANLSGGERQLVLIARAIAQKAEILIMDEPSASLDFGNRLRVMQTVRNLTKEGYCVIQSTHDPEQAYLYSDKILALHDGCVLACGTPQEIFDAELISKLYGVAVSVHPIENDAHRVCIPKGEFL